MAKYTINYACGHGSHVEQLYGKTADRERRIAWEEQNIVCKECYIKQAKEKDAKADKVLTLTMAPSTRTVTLHLEADGQLEANKEALKALGYAWQDSQAGLMGILSTRKPKKVLALSGTFSDMDGLTVWLVDKGDEAAALGYVLKDGLSVLDTHLISKLFAEAAEHKEVLAADPKPPVSPLRQRITDLEKASGKKWNGKLYGRAGDYNFYVDGVNHSATDKEVKEREENLKLHEAWRARIAAATTTTPNS